MQESGLYYFREFKQGLRLQILRDIVKNNKPIRTV